MLYLDKKMFLTFKHSFNSNTSSFLHWDILERFNELRWYGQLDGDLYWSDRFRRHNNLCLLSHWWWWGLFLRRWFWRRWRCSHWRHLLGNNWYWWRLHPWHHWWRLYHLWRSKGVVYDLQQCGACCFAGFVLGDQRESASVLVKHLRDVQGVGVAETCDLVVRWHDWFIVEQPTYITVSMGRKVKNIKYAFWP